MRQLFAVPRFNSNFRRGDNATFRLVDDQDVNPEMEVQSSIFSFEWPESVEKADTTWELIRVRSNRSRKEMNLPRVLNDEDYIVRFSARGQEANWQLVPGNYVLRVILNNEIVCENSFLVPYSEVDQRIEKLESILDESRAPRSLRTLVVRDTSEIVEELASRLNVKDSDSGTIESAFELSVRQLAGTVSEEHSDTELRELLLNSSLKIFRDQSHLMGQLEKVFELTSDRPYDDHELEALINIFIRGTDLSNYDEYGILQVMINNAKRLKIDEVRKRSSVSARMRLEEERDRQERGYAEKTDLSRQIPEGDATEFDDRKSKLTAKQKRLITPRLVISILNHADKSEKSIEIPIEDTWTIGRQSSEEFKKMGEWSEPTIDFDHRRIIMAGFCHNVFSKNHLAIIPTYKHMEFMDLGRTVSLYNPSKSYSITLGEEITLGPLASYATPNHLFFYYRVGPDEIQLNESELQRLKLSQRARERDFTIRIDVFFDDMKKGDFLEVLVAKHEWIDHGQSVSVLKNLSRTRAPG